MPNIFDGLRSAAQSTVLGTMGVLAQWVPSNGGVMQTATVLFKNPTQKDEILDQDFQDIAPRIEFLEGAFVGLVESVMNNGTEKITVDGDDFYCYKAVQKFDGKTVIIYLQEPPQ